MAGAAQLQRSLLEVTADEAGLRLDAFLVRRALAPSAAAARRLLAEAVVQIEGQSARKGQRLRAGDRVLLVLGTGSAAIASDGPPPPPLRVLYLDDALVAIDKPAGIPSHPLRPDEGGTAVTALLRQHPECGAASPDPREGGLVHRLDVGTSGVLIAARDPASWTTLRQTLGGVDSQKSYLVEVVGRMPESAGGQPVVIEAPIGRVGRRGDRVRIGAGRGLMAARTEVVALAFREQSTLCEARLSRGRPHQVRAHLAHLGFPVAGDALYGRWPGPGGEAGLHLHAWKVRFPHPTSGAPIEIVAPAPVWAEKWPVNPQR